MNGLSKRVLWILVLAVMGASAVPATNGMYMTGYGPETIGRGGVNLAIADRTLALNFNPAGISQLQGDHFTVSLAVLAPSLDFENMANSRFDGQDDYFPLPAFAWVRASRESPWSYGLGFIAQGGMGATFDNENTFFGSRDGTSTEVRFGTLSPTVAYSFNDDLAIGFTANIGYADASFSFFPETSFFNSAAPEFSFFGVDMNRAGGLQTSGRLGLWWRPHPRFSVGAIYQTKTNSDFEGGDMTVNFDGHPLLGQNVHYTADMSGFTFAAQAGVGFAFRASDRWLIGVDVKQYFWDSAIDTIQVVATDPDVVGAPPRIEMPFVFDWKDQWIYALGLEYRASDTVTLRAGYNHGENPVPSNTLTPLFPATVEDHVSLGIGWLRGNKTWEVALERTFDNTQANPNLDPMVNPFGPGSTVGHEQWMLAVGVSWAQDR